MSVKLPSWNPVRYLSTSTSARAPVSSRTPVMFVKVWCKLPDSLNVFTYPKLREWSERPRRSCNRHQIPRRADGCSHPTELCPMLIFSFHLKKEVNCWLLLPNAKIPSSWLAPMKIGTSVAYSPASISSMGSLVSAFWAPARWMTGEHPVNPRPPLYLSSL